MKITVKEGLPGFTLVNPARFKAFLDDQEIGDCYAADDEGGVAWVYERVDGRFVLDEDRQNVKSKMLRGKVEIREVL